MTSDERGGVGRAAGLAVLHGAIAFALAPMVLMSYTYGRFGLSSWDQLAWIEPSPWLAFGAAWTPFWLFVPLALSMATDEGPRRRWLWKLQVGGIAATVVLTLITFASFSSTVSSGR